MRGLPLLLLVAAPLCGALTTVQDTIYNADGSKVSGVLAITWSAFKSAGGQTIAAGRKEVRVVDGQLAIQLEPNAGAVPSGTSYQVRIVASGGAATTETWVVPASATPVRVSDVRSTVIPSPDVRVQLQQLAVGGAHAGDVVGFNGTSWGPATGGGSPGGAAGGDLSGTYPAPSVAQVGGSSAANLHTAEQRANAATTATSPSTIPLRDAAGNLPLGTGALTGLCANDDCNGTVLHKLAKLTGSPSAITISTTSDIGGVIGVVVSGAGTSGSAQVATHGRVYCDFDGPTRAGDYVQISATVAGDCHDAGSLYPTNGQALGRVLSTNAAAGTYEMWLESEANGYPSAGSSPQLVTTPGQGYFFGITIERPQSSGATSTFSANNTRVWQFLLPFGAVIGRITFEVTSASGAGKNLGLGLYDASCSNLVLSSGVLTAGGPVDINTIGIKTQQVLNGPVTLQGGVYYLAMTTDSSTLVLRSLVTDSKGQAMLNTDANKLDAQAGNSGTAGALPLSCGTLTAPISSVAPMALFRR